MLMKNLDELKMKGDWCFMLNDSRIAIKYGGETVEITIIPISVLEDGLNWNWRWDGNRECPTLSPSILVHGNEITVGWHGYMRGGVLMEA